MSEYKRPSQGEVRGGVPMFYSGTEVDRLLTPKTPAPRHRFSMPDLFSDVELRDIVGDPAIRAVAIAAVGVAGMFGWVQWNKDTKPRTISQVTPIERVVERPQVKVVEKPQTRNIPYYGEESSLTWVRQGEEVEVDANAVVSGDVVVLVNGREVRTFDDNSKTGELVLTDRRTRIRFPYGGQVDYSRPGTVNNLVDKRVDDMKRNGCVNGCTEVHVHTNSSLEQSSPAIPVKRTNSI